MSNVEVMYSIYFKKDRAQRLHPSAFHIPTSAFVKFLFPDQRAVSAVSGGIEP
jgi:hypothetical protein